jgi:hypothetical protein
MTKPWRRPGGVVISKRRSTPDDVRKWRAGRVALLKGIETALQAATGPERLVLLLQALNLSGGKIPYWLHTALRRDLIERMSAPETPWVHWNVMDALINHQDPKMKQEEAKHKAAAIVRGTEHEREPDTILKNYKRLNRRLGRQRRWWRKG